MVWNIPAGDVEKAKGWLKKDLEFAGITENNALTQYSKVQTAGVIDELYGQKAFDTYNAKQLGAVVERQGYLQALGSYRAQRFSCPL